MSTEPRQAKVEKIERGSAFENEFPAKERMFMKLVEKLPKAKYFLEIGGVKAG
jgi:hypothetical protein